jgi:hypothetical protein
MSTSYWFRASKSKIVRIAPDEDNASQWCISLNDQLLAGRYGSAEEAAYCAKHHDFGDELSTDLFNGVSVPENLSSWSQTPPELQAQAEHTAKPRDCRDRHRKPASTQL